MENINLLKIKDDLKTALSSMECILDEIDFIDDMNNMSEDLKNEYEDGVSDSCCYITSLIDSIKYRLSCVNTEIMKGIK